MSALKILDLSPSVSAAREIELDARQMSAICGGKSLAPVGIEHYLHKLAGKKVEESKGGEYEEPTISLPEGGDWTSLLSF